MNENKKIYYDIYNEFYSVNKFRELKTIVHHGDNRLNHINRVAKMSFAVSKRLGLDYISCTRGALMHDFFTTDDVSKNDYRYKQFLNKHPVEALNNSLKYFDVNDMEEDIILSHMYPITRKKPKFKESKVVSICDKLVSFYEFFRYDVRYTAFVFMIRLLPNYM